MRHRLSPILAASLITGLVACGMLVIGVAAALNPNGVRAADSPAAAALQDPAASPADAQAQIAQLQDLVRQYQDRESQYQAQLQQAATSLQAYQQILMALQESGLIRITRDGRILVQLPGGSDG